MKETFGLANAKNAKPPNPKPSPKDFAWPSQRDMDDSIAKKIAASLQELLPARGWKHTDLAKAMYGTAGANEAPRNVAAPRRWVVAEHPIPNETAAGYIAEILDVPMSRLMEPKGKFLSFPPMIRGRSDSKRFPFKGTPKTHATKAKKEGRTASGKDREKQRAYNTAYRERKRAEAAGRVKRKYTKHAKPKLNGHGEIREDGTWVLAEGLTPPEYKISSSGEHAGHVELEVTATLPHSRAMAILHMLQHEAADSES